MLTKATYGPYEINKVNQHMSYDTYVPNEYDSTVDQFKHLRASEEFRKLHIFHARRIGVQRFIQLAKTAEQEGKSPGKYFTWLLKNAK